MSRTSTAAILFACFPCMLEKMLSTISVVLECHPRAMKSFDNVLLPQNHSVRSCQEDLLMFRVSFKFILSLVNIKCHFCPAFTS